MPISQSSRVGGAGMLALVATYGIGRLAYGLFVPAFQNEFDLPLDVLGFYASAAQAGYLVATVMTGVVTARYGPRVPVVSGCLLLAFGAAVTASAPGPTWLAVGMIAVGASAGGTWAPFSDAVTVQVAPAGSRRALALVNAGAPLGLVVASAVMLVAGERWRTAWWGFAAVGLLAAVVTFRVLTASRAGTVARRSRPRLGWFFTGRSLQLFTVALGLSITCGAYFTYAPDTVQQAGFASWVGPTMWALLGITGAAVGSFAGAIANRYGIATPLAVMLLLVGGATLALLINPMTLLFALFSASLFGVGFTTGFGLVVIWSQEVFYDRPTTGFTLTIVFIAAGFIIGPSLFGVVVTHLGRPMALLVAAAPAFIVIVISPLRIAHFKRDDATFH